MIRIDAAWLATAPLDMRAGTDTALARMNGHDPYAYLKDVLTRLPTHRASRIEELLPHRWQAPNS